MAYKSIIFSLLTLFLLASFVSAWGNYTYTYVCDQAVGYVWGSDVLDGCINNQTIDFQKSYCEKVVLESEGEAAYNLCMAAEELVHPAVYSTVFFDDLEEHRDYSSCPIRSDNDARYLCSSNKTNLALGNALMWLDSAKDVNDVCTRVYDFCIASSYLADTVNPLNHILYGADQGSCSATLDEKVDKRLVDPLPSWSASQVCSFRYLQKLTGQTVPKRYAQQFSITNKTFVDLIVNLTAYGQSIAYLPYGETTTTIETTTTMLASTTMATSIPTTTRPPVSSSTTTLVQEDSGMGWFPLLIVLVIIVAVVLYVMNQVNLTKTPKLRNAGKGRFDGRPRKHERKGLIDDDDDDDPLSHELGRSKLRDVELDEVDEDLE